MTSAVTISLDAMGGDHAPGVVVAGVAQVAVRYPSARFLLFGDGERIEPLLTESVKAVAEIRHTDARVPNDAKPSQALRKGANSSMRLAIDAVRDGEAQGVVSGGNTGALMAMSKFSLRTLPGIYRPALASFLPTLRGESVMLDLGANVQCDPENLVQFAVMGADFCRAVLGRQLPTVGLLNVGEEELKGNDTVRAAHDLLRRSDNLDFSYHGFVEGTDITRGTVDVIVTDGFTGNVALKTAEGTARLITHYLGLAFRASWLSRLGYVLARSSLGRLRARLDPNNYNGGVFLGLNGIAVKSHGSSDAKGFEAAIALAIDMASDELIEKIRNNFQEFDFHKKSAKAAASGAA